jgi:hypothetical protein
MARARRIAEEHRPYAVLYPAIAEAARRTGASAVGLVDAGGAAGLNLVVDGVAITYSNGQSVGDPASPVQVSASLVRTRRIQAAALPPVVARIAVGPDLLDVSDPEDAAWLRTCLGPDPKQLAGLEAQLRLTAAVRPVLLRGDPVELLAEAVARVPTDVLPVITTTWALSRLSGARRVRFVQRMADAALRRPVAWVSVEGVGVAPTIPTLGDRPASGHSIIGLTVFERSTPRSEAVGRCWSRGRMLSWFADPHA